MIPADRRGAAMTEAARHWSTGEARPGKALNYWVEAICEAFLEMKADSPAPTDFSASIAQHPFGPIDLNYADTTSQEVWRTKHAIAGSRKHTFYLLYMRAGKLRARQRGREALVQPGDCVLIDSMEPYSFSFPGANRCLSVQMPDDWVRQWIKAPESATAISFSASGWGRRLAHAVGDLAEQDFDTLALPRASVADELGALLSLAGGRAETKSAHRDILLQRLQLNIRERMHDGALDAQSIADASGISRRYLHLLFAEAGTSFGADLMSMRLERARQFLSDTRFAGESIGEIASRCGFREPSHFARRFRAAFGAAPAAFRQSLRA
jgi:AraC family transcriptional activator of tynA and feaB